MTSKNDNKGSKMGNGKNYGRDGVFERGERSEKKQPQRSFSFFGSREDALDDEAFLDSVMANAYSRSHSAGSSVRFVPPPFPKKDSFTDPYAIDFLPADATGTPFQMGMGMHPGRKDAGTKADWNRDLRADFSRIWEAGVRTIVCMVEEHEFGMLRVPEYIREAETFGFEVIWFPVRDVSTPVSFRQMHKCCYEVWQRLQAGHVLVHCRGGKGRTGTLACCYLELLGWTFDAALKLVRSTRKGTVETQSQEKWCAEFERYFHVIKQRRAEANS